MPRDADREQQSSAGIRGSVPPERGSFAASFSLIISHQPLLCGVVTRMLGSGPARAPEQRKQ
jgi:hypothetical protein